MKQSASNLVDIAIERAESHGEKVSYTFLEDGEEQTRNLSFAELDRQARSVGAALQQTYLPGTRIIIALPPGLDYVVSFWACLYAGLTAVPLYPPMNPKHVGRMLSVMEDCAATAVLTLAPLAQIMKSWLSAQGSNPARYRWIEVDRLPRDEFASWQRRSLARSDLAFLQYTSGSTGEPKGVMLSHGALSYNSSLIADAYTQVFTTANQPMTEVSISWLPPYHDLGLIDGVLQPVYAGKHAVLMSPLAFLEKPVRWLRAISRYRGGTSGGPCFGYDLCARKVPDEALAGLDLSSWVCSYNAAEPIRREIVERFTTKFARCGYRRESFTPVYGLAEASLLVTADCKYGNNYWMKPQREVEGVEERAQNDYALVSLGHARGDTQLCIVDPETGITCAPNEIGEAWISGSSLASGYWGKPELNEQVFAAYTRDEDGAPRTGPFFRTGDLGLLTGDGTFFITGRLKDLIIVRGKNHYPQDIESTAQASHAGLRSGGGAAFAVTRDDGEGLVIVQEVRPSLPADQLGEALRAIESTVLATHGLAPHDVVLIEQNTMPKTSSGKTRRFKAREEYLRGELAVRARLMDNRASPDVEVHKLARKIERKMVTWIAEHADLDIHSVGRDESFSAFGVDSVAVMELIGSVETLVGFKIPDGAAAQCNTINQMIAYLQTEIASRLTGSPPVLETTAQDGASEIDFVVPSFDGAWPSSIEGVLDDQ